MIFDMILILNFYAVAPITNHWSPLTIPFSAAALVGVAEWDGALASL
jgi:hypothetical protein